MTKRGENGGIFMKKINKSTEELMEKFKEEFGIKFVDVETGEEIDLGEDDAE